jgi:hypothetical protein
MPHSTSSCVAHIPYGILGQHRDLGTDVSTSCTCRTQNQQPTLRQHVQDSTMLLPFPFNCFRPLLLSPHSDQLAQDIATAIEVMLCAGTAWVVNNSGQQFSYQPLSHVACNFCTFGLHDVQRILEVRGSSSRRYHWCKSSHHRLCLDKQLRPRMGSSAAAAPATANWHVLPL